MSGGNLNFVTFDVSGSVGTEPTNISSVGQVTGYYYLAGGGSEGFLYTTGTITTFDVPGALNTTPVSINEAGQITGFYNSGGANSGFIDVAGDITTFEVPGATDTTPTAMNSAGQIVGHYNDGGSDSGFIYSSGTFMTFDISGAIDTVPTSINDEGDITGYYSTPSSGSGVENHGFIDIAGAITTFDVSGSSLTIPTSINDVGQITGYCIIGADASGFLDSTGTITTFGSQFGFSQPYYAYALDINDSGQIVGRYGDGNTTSGFIYTTTTTTTFDVPGAIDSTLLDINDAGQIVGTDTDATGTYGFLAAPCFCSGTHVATEDGAARVEDLKVGERVLSLFGCSVPVVWIGHRRINCRRHPKPTDIWPIRVSRSAFGDGQPHADLWLSPDHAVFINGVLIPIRYLVNAKTVAQEPVDEVIYWHVELGQHDVIFAEGLATESYLDTGNRGAFANGAPAVQMHPDFALRVWETKACAPLVRDGVELETARRSLLARAEVLGYTTTGDPALHLVVDDRRVLPKAIGSLYQFYLPETTRDIRLVSRSAVPAEVSVDAMDHRRLGVAVSRILLDEKPIPLFDLRLISGWHVPEHDGAGSGWRWTNGDAGLALDRVRTLTINVAMTERYWPEPTDRATNADCPSSRPRSRTRAR